MRRWLRWFSTTTQTQKATDRNLWDATDETMKHVKKALSLLPKLKGEIVNLDEDSKVFGHLSGHNDPTLFCVTFLTECMLWNAKNKR